MATVTDATLRASVWETLFDAFTAASYSSSAEPGVYRNNEDLDESSTFPRITVSPIDVSSERVSLGRGAVMNRMDVMVDIYAKKNKDIDVIADKLYSLLEATKYTGFSYVGGVDALTINTDVGSKIHQKTITFTFIRG